MPLRVAVDLVFFTGRKGGTETYSRNLFPALRAHDDLRFVGIGNRELAAAPPAWFPGDIVTLPVSGENRVAWAAAVALALAPKARGIGADLLHCPSNFGPAVRLLPTVVTVHDLLPLRHPEWVPGGRARGVQALTRAGVRAASRIITVSSASASDITSLLGRSPADIDVIPHGIEPTDTARRAVEPVRRPYLLSAGNRMPHKNFEALLQALALIPPVERPRLVITGGHGDDPLRGIVERLGLHDDVSLRGWVAEAELGALYAGATAYVFPSLFEGFGLPMLEAMARGCPLISSDIPVLREVGGDDAIYVDARSPAAVAAAIRDLVRDPDAQAALSAAGRKRAATFSLAGMADATAAVYRRLARS